MYRIANIRPVHSQNPTTGTYDQLVKDTWLCQLNGIPSLVFGFSDEASLTKAANAGQIEPTGNTTQSGASLVFGPIVVPPTEKELAMVKKAFLASKAKQRVMVADLVEEWAPAAEPVLDAAA